MGKLRSRTGMGVALALLFFLVSGLAWSQAGTSTIRGMVTDPQGKVISGATVTLKNPATNFSRTQVTTSTGSFSFELIPPGEYQIEVEMQGFKKHTLGGVRALVGAPTDQDIALEIGSRTETVLVEAATTTVILNTQDATLGNNFVSQQIAQLPLEARNVIDLLTLQPGVTRDGYVAGARSDQSNITLDGVDINEAQTNSLTSPVLRLNSEAIEEFRVNTVNANANQGRSSAAQVNLVTKSGTNQFHGSVFEEHRNTIFTANDFFSNRSGVKRPVLLRNTFGAALGGPVMKNKLFFFYSYEGRRDASQSSVLSTVPTPSMGLGQMKALSSTGAVLTFSTADLNDIFKLAQINPAAVAVFAAAAKKYPANDFGTTGDSIKNPDGSVTLMNTAGFRFNAPTPVKLNSNVARLDWNINSKQNAFFRFNAIYDLTTNAPAFPDTPGPNSWSHPYGFAAGHTWTIGRSWVNSARYGLTRMSFSNLGDSNQNNISFRFIFSPLNFTRTLSRVTPVHNIIDDVSWVRGSHTIQFGTNIRIIANTRDSFAGAYDFAQANPSGYAGAGAQVSTLVQNWLADPSRNLALGSSWVVPVRWAATALIGRYNDLRANLIYGPDLNLQPVGTPSHRTFSTQNYDLYIQDAWKITRNITLSYGLRYGLSRPIYETHGFQVAPTIPLGQYFRNRVDAGLQGTNYNVPVVINLSGPVNGGPAMYPWDYKNFQPRAAIAWSPGYTDGWLGKLFGGANKSVIRGGFAIVSDYFGEALAAFFDLQNTLGFSSSAQIPVNTYNVTDRLGPLFTSFSDNVRSSPALSYSTKITFPQQKSTNVNRIESSIDSQLQTPKEYMWNLTLERELGAGLTLQFAYVGRMGRHLLAQRDVMAMNNLVDPISKTDWYTNAAKLEAIHQTLPFSGTLGPTFGNSYAPATMPYFDNVFPSNLATLMNNYYGLGCTAADPCIPSTFTPTQTIFWIMNNLYMNNDWTDVQADLDQERLFVSGLPTLFFQNQYGALNVWSTVANSNYHGFAVSARQRFHNLQWDFNYTYAHSLDDASGLQNAGAYSGAAFIMNPLRQRQSYASSGFDIRHLINVNAIYPFPIGRGQWIGRNMGRGWDALLGGWQLSGIFRWNTGLPTSSAFDLGSWVTNFQLSANTTITRPVEPCISRQTVQYFGCNNTAAYQSMRNAYPGETGARNVFRLQGYINLDAGLFKKFDLSWAHIGEKANAQLRWEVFNVTNTQHFAGVGNFSKASPTSLTPTPPPNWATFSSIQGNPRVMQVGLRIEF